MKNSRQTFRFFLILMLGVILSACSVKYSGQEGQLALQNTEVCLSCALYETIVNILSNVTFFVFSKVAVTCRLFLSLGLAFWLLFHGMKFVSTFKNPKPSNFWSQMLLVLGKGVFVGFILSADAYFVWLLNTFIFPVMQAFITSAVDVMLISAGNYNNCNKFLEEVFNGNLLTQNFEITRSGNKYVFPHELITLLKVMAFHVQLAFMNGVNLGYRIWTQGTFFGGLCGIGIMILFAAMVVCYPFYLIDGFLKSCIAVILLPFMLVLWVFPKTSGTLGKVWKFFLASLIQIFIMAIFVGISTSVVTEYGLTTDFSPIDPTSLDQWVARYLSLSLSALQKVAVCFYLFVLMKRALLVAASFGGSASKSEFQGLFSNLKKSAVGTVGTIGKIIGGK